MKKLEQVCSKGFTSPMHCNKDGKILGYAIALTALITASILGISMYLSSSTIHELLTENHELNKAIRNLTDEQQIGYATLQSSTRNAHGEIESVVRFVQTAPGHPKQIVSEQLFTVPGEIVHFDALLIKFNDEYVKDGKGRALYLWRRVYGEFDAPADGTTIEVPGSAPERYYDITKTLKINDRDVFWEAVWELANDPQQLSSYGITAVYGEAIYFKLAPDKLYHFKISPQGQIYAEVVDAR